MDYIYITVRDDDNLEWRASQILESSGLDISKAVQLLLKRIVMDGSLPFDRKATERDFKILKSYMRVYGEEYAEYVSQVPEGMIMRECDLIDFLSKTYSKRYVHLEHRFVLHNKSEQEAPWWRVVSKNGYLLKCYRNSRYKQKAKLEEEGLNIVFGGQKGTSFLVEDFQDHLFKDFKKLDEE